MGDDVIFDHDYVWDMPPLKHCERGLGPPTDEICPTASIHWGSIVLQLPSLLGMVTRTFTPYTYYDTVDACLSHRGLRTSSIAISHLVQNIRVL